jgi:hypothetical protein
MTEELGVPASKLFMESASFDTIGNAFFARTMHTDVRGWRNLLVITSEFHMPRTEAIFRTVFSLKVSSEDLQYQIQFLPASDDGVAESSALSARRAKESQSLAGWHRTASKLQTLADLHMFMYNEHACYAVPSVGQSEKRNSSSAQALYSTRV